MMKIAGIDFTRTPNEGFDDPLGESMGAGVIFGKLHPAALWKPHCVPPTIG
ncbi:MAG: hypothetical protein U5N56_12610 [Candidatus Marinimicrobia bacterium]|nr:hypothetical protein [Candidatus Neomarinimicrobiota bacterium]